MSDPNGRPWDALPEDPEEVTEALEIAAALWDKGERSDAIRWVRRAAEAAADAGNTARLATLAGAAADLEQSPPPPPPAPQPPPLRTVPPRPAHITTAQTQTTTGQTKVSRAPDAPPRAPPAIKVPAPAPVPQRQQGLRVSVRASVRDATLLVVRPLAEGQAAPPGTREAFLVLPDAPSTDAGESRSLG